jgi:hypothetical protein
MRKIDDKKSDLRRRKVDKKSDCMMIWKVLYIEKKKDRVRTYWKLKINRQGFIRV